jgi:metallophosphoesterase (TIGR03767 family)
VRAGSATGASRGSPRLTTDRRLDAGPVQRRGSVGIYRDVSAVEGEPHAVRGELVGDVAANDLHIQTGPSTSEHPHPALPLKGEGKAIACIAHLTDLHVTDVQSPGRFEFVNREYGDPRFRELLPMQRPHEALNAHAIEAMVQTINRIELGPVTGSPLQLVVLTGDAIDNTQWNELAAFMALLDGGLVHPDSGGQRYEGVQALDWPDDVFWKPDNASLESDLFRRGYGFPHVPGLLQRALKEFNAVGLRLPWLGCHGNHEEVCQGVGIITKELAAGMVGTHKPLRLPDGLDRDAALETFVNRPEVFMEGPGDRVTPDPARRPVTRAEFVDAHFGAGARPDGHGFTAHNQRDGTAYYVFDTPAVRYINLDTVCPAGGADGAIDAAQVRWLERKLEEVHSSFRSRDGSTVSTDHDDRLVVICSHHGLDTISNPRARPGEEGSGYVASAELLAILLRFQNVVLWLNGHIHANRVRAREDPSGLGGGFWEVTTSSIVDWPCQARLVEIVEAGPGILAIACTMVDHEGRRDATGSAGLAGLHRELSGNVPIAGFGSNRAGTPLDRNVILPVRAPF